MGNDRPTPARRRSGSDRARSAVYEYGVEAGPRRPRRHARQQRRRRRASSVMGQNASQRRSVCPGRSDQSVRGPILCRDQPDRLVDIRGAGLDRADCVVVEGQRRMETRLSVQTESAEALSSTQSERFLRGEDNRDISINFINCAGDSMPTTRAGRSDDLRDRSGGIRCEDRVIGARHIELEIAFRLNPRKSPQ